MSRRAWKLPVDDDEFIAGLARNGYNRAAYAREAGCTATHVALRARRLGIANVAPPKVHRPRFLDRMAVLERTVAALEERLLALESRPAGGIIEWRPDHRRIVDGGTQVRAQRRAAGVTRRPSRRTA